MQLSQAKIAAIFKTAEDVLYDVDKNHQLSDDELADRIVIQARFIDGTQPPSVPQGTKDIAKRVVEIADGPELAPIAEETIDATKDDPPAAPTPGIASFALDGYLATDIFYGDGRYCWIAELLNEEQAQRSYHGEVVRGLNLAEIIQQRIAGDTTPGYLGRVKITVEYEQWIEEETA